jgi:hypothetical protein
VGNELANQKAFFSTSVEQEPRALSFLTLSTTLFATLSCYT